MTADGVVLVTSEGTALCLDAATGDVRWRKRLGRPVNTPPVAAGEDAVLVAGDDGSICSLASATGDAMWRLPKDSATAGLAQIGDDRFAYVNADHGLVIASLATASPVPGDGRTHLLRTIAAARGDGVWALAEDESLRVLGGHASPPTRRMPVPAASAFPPAVDGDTACAVGSDGGVLAYRTSGDLQFSARIDEPPSGPAVFSNGRVYVPGSAGHLYVLDGKSGALLWRFDAKSRITAAPVIAHGTIYVTTSAGRLWALAE